MSRPDLNASLVPIQPVGLASKATAALAKRGLDQLQSIESAETWFQRALDLSLDAELEKSHKCLLRVIELDPSHINALLWLGWDFQDGTGTDSNLHDAVIYLGNYIHFSLD